MSLVTLIRPNMLVAKWAFSAPTCPPIGVAYLASSLMEAGYSVHVIDSIGEGVFQYLSVREDLLSHGLSDEEIISRIPEDSKAIGFSLMFSHEFPIHNALIKKVRRAFPRAFLFTGGEHSTSQPRETLQICPALDAVVLGEGEETAVALLNAVKNSSSLEEVAGICFREPNTGALVRTPPRQRIRNVDDIPEPAWKLFKLPAYLDNHLGMGTSRGRSIPMLASRGCPFECTFCSNPTMWTQRWIPRDPEKVLNEAIQYIHRYDIQNIDFYDLTAIVRKEWIVKFCKLIISSGYRFTWQLPSGTRSEAIDQEVTELLFASGCRNITYAPESGSPTVLKRIKKQVKLEKIETSMKAAVQSGLNVRANMILGFPDETYKEVWESFRFMARMAWIGVHDSYMSGFTPYPGSELFDQLRQAHKIPEMNDDYYFSLVSFQDMRKSNSWSDAISPWALTLFRFIGPLIFYSVSYLRRPWRLGRLLMNLLRGSQESRLEKSLSDMIQRLLLPRRAPASAILTHPKA